MADIVVVYIWQGQAYIPTQAKYESGIFIGTEPVLIVELNSNELLAAIQTIKDKGHKILQEPKTREEFLASEVVGRQLHILSAYAKLYSGQAYFYYAEGTPQEVINLAIKWLGKSYVIPIP